MKAGSGVLGLGQDGSGFPEAGSDLQEAGSGLPKAGSGLPEAGLGLPEASSGFSGAGVGLGGGWTYGREDLPCVLQDFVPLWGRSPKRRRREAKKVVCFFLTERSSRPYGCQAKRFVSVLTLPFVLFCFVFLGCGVNQILSTRL